jgi:hypothetical protein
MFKKHPRFLLIILPTLLFFSCNNHSASPGPGTKNDAAFALSSILVNDSSVLKNDPLVKSAVQKINNALQQKVPVLFLENADSSQAMAQLIASSDPRFRENLFDKNYNQPLRNEIFAVYPARPGDLPANYYCTPGKCYRVELYNYAYNLTTIILVDLQTQKVVSINNFPQTQPDIPEQLKNLALKIAVNAPEVITALGISPKETEALMASTKTALNRTKCERSMHLCVAPTFVKGDKALWAIVDLTDLKLVGVRWTQVGTNGAGERISERKLQFDKIMECYCKQETALSKNDWKLKYTITSSDGLRISDVNYKNKLVIQNAKLVDWHVSYSGTEGFGYSDAVGCPEYSQAAVIAVSEPVVKELEENGKTVGFVLEQSFQSEQWPRPCNYNYIQRYEFYNDGRWRTAAANLGRGCGNNGTYRPVTRIVLPGDENNFSEWNGSTWNNWITEKWQLQNERTSYSPEGYQYRVYVNKSDGFYLIPGKGQFADGGRGDNAYVYVTKYHIDKDEGESDLVTIGPCCNIDYRQGPEKFMTPAAESIQNSRLVIWYVAQLKNNDTKGNEYCWADNYIENGIYKTKAYPCFSGPLFVPINP